MDWSGEAFPPPGDLPNPGIKPRSPTLWEDSLPAKPQGKPKNTGEGSRSRLQQIFPTQESNWGLLHRRWILHQLSYQWSPSFSGKDRPKSFSWAVLQNESPLGHSTTQSTGTQGMMMLPFSISDFNQLKLRLSLPLPQSHAEFSPQAPSWTACTLNLKLPQFCSSRRYLLWKRPSVFPLLETNNKSFFFPIFDLTVSFDSTSTKRWTSF